MSNRTALALAIALSAVCLASPALPDDPKAGDARAALLADLTSRRDEVIGTLLRSAEERDVAAACSIIRGERRSAFRPQLGEVLARARDFTPPAAQQVLGAALELDLQAPFAVASHFARTGPTWCRIPAMLAARTLGAEEMLSLWDAVADEALPLEAIPIGNRLARSRAPGFAFRLLSGLELCLMISVSDAEAGEQPFVRPTGRVPSDCITTRDSRYPPFLEYRLSLGPAVGSVVVSEGPIPVYMAIRSRGEEEIGHGGAELMSGQRALRMLLRDMLLPNGGPDEIPEGLHVRIRWSTAEQFLQRAESEKLRVAASYWDLVSMAIAGQLLTRDEAARLAPRLRLLLADERSASGELPTVPGFPSANPYGLR